ncbi:MAG: hypothetical protein AAF567_07245 [Actinomycetota bacterium]
MTSNPIRLFARLCIALAALTLVIGVAPDRAAAQDVGSLEVGSDEANTGTNTSDADSDEPNFQVGRGIHFVIPDVQPGDAGNTGGTGGTGGGDAGTGLAVTGTDVEPIVAISAGLLALGGSALVASRRRLRSVA